jgi:UDP-N-acetylmuramyl pentapeptide phosphotransferase/UDP-N-acetylglucosamine-1-phosphate transferase
MKLYLLSLTMLAAAATAGFLWLLLATGLAWRLAVDVPNHRSLHGQTIPRIGGCAIVPVVILGLLIVAIELWPLAGVALFIAVVSQIDDRCGLSARIRFVAQCLAAFVMIKMYSPPLDLWQMAVLIIAFVWWMNLYNFMDGADGLAGGMTLFGFGAYALAAAQAAPDLAQAAALIGGAAAGFLVFNLPPARVFLGDAGSVPLGLLSSTLGYIGFLRGVWPIWFPMMVFSPFIADASATLGRRILRGEKFWQAHREHYFQRMIQMQGNNHASVIKIAYGLIAISTLLAGVGLHVDAKIQAIGAAGWIMTLVYLGWRIDVRWRRFAQAPRNSGA